MSHLRVYLRKLLTDSCLISSMLISVASVSIIIITGVCISAVLLSFILSYVFLMNHFDQVCFGEIVSLLKELKLKGPLFCLVCSF